MNSTLKGKEMAIEDMIDVRGLRVPGNTPCYISVDIEATGPTPGHYSMYELGACVVGGSECFERNIALLPRAGFSSEALRAVGMTKKKLLTRNDTVSPKRAMREFGEWAKSVAHGDELIFIANNAPFDWMFVAWYFDEVHVKNPFGHAALDMKAYYMGLTKSSWRTSSLRGMAKYGNIPFVSLPHNALADAKIQGNIFQKLI